jgi:hypothetical protein
VGDLRGCAILSSCVDVSVRVETSDLARWRPGNGLSSLSLALCTNFSKNAGRDDFSGCDGLKVSLQSEFAASEVETLDDPSHLESHANASISENLMKRPCDELSPQNAAPRARVVPS